MRKIGSNKYLVFIIGLILGAIIILAVRFFTYAAPSPEKVHYHANFAVYINGQREQFKALNYYEEEAAASCSVSTAAESENSPMARTHMHDNINDVVHVEDSLVSWGNFFGVLGWGVGKNYLSTRDTVFTPTSTDSLTYILNGKKVDDISNTIIKDQDKLLVNYGSQPASQIQEEYNGIQNNAKKADNSKDPAACGGSAVNKTTFHDRITHLF